MILWGLEPIPVTSSSSILQPPVFELWAGARVYSQNTTQTREECTIHSDKAPTSWGITASTNGPTGCSVGPNTRQVQTSGKESDLLWWLTQVKEPLQVNKYQQSSLEETDPWRQICKHGNGSSLSDVVLSQTRTSFPVCKGQMSSPSGGFFPALSKTFINRY